MTYYIFRADPDLSPPPSPDATVSVAMTVDDGRVVTVGTKMFSSSDVSHIDRVTEERKTGRVASSGTGYSLLRWPVSHGNTLNIPMDGVYIEDELFENLDKIVRHSIAALVERRVLIVSQNADKTASGSYIDPSVIRSL